MKNLLSKVALDSLDSTIGSRDGVTMKTGLTPPEKNSSKPSAFPNTGTSTELEALQDVLKIAGSRDGRGRGTTTFTDTVDSYNNTADDHKHMHYSPGSSVSTPSPVKVSLSESTSSIDGLIQRIKLDTDGKKQVPGDPGSTETADNRRGFDIEPQTKPHTADLTSSDDTTQDQNRNYDPLIHTPPWTSSSSSVRKPPVKTAENQPPRSPVKGAARTAKQTPVPPGSNENQRYPGDDPTTGRGFDLEPAPTITVPTDAGPSSDEIHSSPSDKCGEEIVARPKEPRTLIGEQSDSAGHQTRTRKPPIKTMKKSPSRQGQGRDQQQTTPSKKRRPLSISPDRESRLNQLATPKASYYSPNSKEKPTRGSPSVRTQTNASPSLQRNPTKTNSSPKSAPYRKSPGSGANLAPSSENMKFDKTFTVNTKNITERTPPRKLLKKGGTKKKMPAPASTPAAPELSPGQSQDLINTVDNFAKYLKDQLSTQSPPVPKKSLEGPVLSALARSDHLTADKLLLNQVQELQEQLKHERAVTQQLKTQSMMRERELETDIRKEMEKSMTELRQRNDELSGRLEAEQDTGNLKKRVISGQPVDGLDQNQLVELRKEIEQQESLIAGYQHENERLYRDLQSNRVGARETETKFYQENKRLTSELSRLKEQLERKEVEFNNKGLITSPNVQAEIAATMAVQEQGRVGDLEARLTDAKKREQNLLEQVKQLNHCNKEIERGVNERRRQEQSEVDLIRQKDFNMSNIVKSKDDEIEKLSSKLKWYIVNQELLDRDVNSLRQKDETIEQLRSKIDQLKSEGQRRGSKDKLTKERAADLRKIQDLERQIKEMEDVLKRRYPNSLPALILAANVGENGSLIPGVQAGEKTVTPTVDFLEKLVKKLEKQLDSKEEDSTRSIRVLEQKYNSMKLQYETRIKELSSKTTTPPSSKPPQDISTLEKDLDLFKEKHRQKVSTLQDRIHGLESELTDKNNQLGQKDSETVYSNSQEVKVKTLQSELELLRHELQTLKNTNNTLRKRNDNMKSKANRTISEQTSKKSNVKKSNLDPQENRLSRTGSLPSLVDYNSLYSEYGKKHYEPNEFKGEHITEVMELNKHYKQKIDNMSIELDHMRIQYRALSAECEARLRTALEDAAEQSVAQKIAHKEDVQRVLANSAVDYSRSKTAEMSSKISTQEVLIKHLRNQLLTAQITESELSTYKAKEEALQCQILKLLEELRIAKKHHTPEMLHFESLQVKLRELELRQTQREKEIQGVIDHARHSGSQESAQEIERWKSLVHNKNVELDKFRGELDTILAILSGLQKQGVVLPTRPYTLS